MLYAILCYHDEDVTSSWTKQQDAAVMKKLAVVHGNLAKQGRMVDCENLDGALDVARDLGAANPGGAYEIRPVGVFLPGGTVT
jgi:hypothetical protein